MNSGSVTSAKSTDSTKWFACPRVKPEAETRLFLFPYAGGGPSAFSRWLLDLPDHIEGWTVHLPGRGSRYSEIPRRNLLTLVEELAPAIQPLLDRPYAFLGHSFGSLLAFELSRQLRRCDHQHPAALFVSACRAPHLPNAQLLIHTLPDEEFLEELRKFDGIPAELSREREVMGLFLPALRGDVEAFETYLYTPEPPLESRIVAFGGMDDPRVSREQLEAWATHTNSTFDSEYFPGDHFFVHSARESVIAAITKHMKGSLPS